MVRSLRFDDASSSPLDVHAATTRQRARGRRAGRAAGLRRELRKIGLGRYISVNPRGQLGDRVQDAFQGRLGHRKMPLNRDVEWEHFTAA